MIFCPLHGFRPIVTTCGTDYGFARLFRVAFLLVAGKMAHLAGRIGYKIKIKREAIGCALLDKPIAISAPAKSFPLAAFSNQSTVLTDMLCSGTCLCSYRSNCNRACR